MLHILQQFLYIYDPIVKVWCCTKKFLKPLHNMHTSAQQVPGSLRKAECWQWATEPNAIPAAASKKPVNNRAVKVKRICFSWDTISATTFCTQ